MVRVYVISATHCIVWYFEECGVVRVYVISTTHCETSVRVFSYHLKYFRSHVFNSMFNKMFDVSAFVRCVVLIWILVYLKTILKISFSCLGARVNVLGGG